MGGTALPGRLVEPTPTPAPSIEELTVRAAPVSGSRLGGRPMLGLALGLLTAVVGIGFIGPRPIDEVAPADRSRPVTEPVDRPAPSAGPAVDSLRATGAGFAVTGRTTRGHERVRVDLMLGRARLATADLPVTRDGHFDGTLDVLPSALGLAASLVVEDPSVPSGSLIRRDVVMTAPGSSIIEAWRVDDGQTGQAASIRVIGYVRASVRSVAVTVSPSGAPSRTSRPTTVSTRPVNGPLASSAQAFGWVGFDIRLPEVSSDPAWSSLVTVAWSDPAAGTAERWTSIVAGRQRRLSARPER